MRHNIFIFWLLLMICHPFPADAETNEAKWVLVGFTKYRDALFVDMNRVAAREDRQVQVWSRITPAERSKYFKQIQRDLKSVGKSPQEFRYVETLYEIDCRNRQIRHVQVIYFRPDGQVIHATLDEGTAWKSVQAGSLWDSLHAGVCRETEGT